MCVVAPERPQQTDTCLRMHGATQAIIDTGRLERDVTCVLAYFAEATTTGLAFDAHHPNRPCMLLAARVVCRGAPRRLASMLASSTVLVMRGSNQTCLCAPCSRRLPKFRSVHWG